MGGGGMRSEKVGQPAERTRGPKGDGRNERHRQMGGGGVRRGNVATSQTRGLEGRDEWTESSVDTADGSLMARYGATAPQRLWTARRLPDGKGRHNGSSTVRDGATAPRRQGTARARRRWTESTTAMGGNGQPNGEWTVIDGAALR
jgi:hypothetical protein